MLNSLYCSDFQHPISLLFPSLFFPNTNHFFRLYVLPALYPLHFDTSEVLIRMIFSLTMIPFLIIISTDLTLFFPDLCLGVVLVTHVYFVASYWVEPLLDMRNFW